MKSMKKILFRPSVLVNSIGKLKDFQLETPVDDSFQSVIQKWYSSSSHIDSPTMKFLIDNC